MTKPLVSIIIPLYVTGDRFIRDLERFRKLRYPRYEIIVVTDNKKAAGRLPPDVRVIASGKYSTGPAEKRDVGIRYAKGTVCAFIDDDAYPDPHWLSAAVRHLSRNKDIVAVGGPGVTPPEDPRMSQLGGMVYKSEYTSGQLKYRFVPLGTRPREVLDWPAYNLIVRTSVLRKVGGWGTTFYGGEDTYICMKMLDHGRIIYDPKSVVFHHRRPLFIPHLRQLFNVGVHRGYFFRWYPETSRQMLYLLPTTLTIGFWILAVLSFFHPLFMGIFLLFSGMFFGIAVSTVLDKRDPVGTILAAAGIILSHMAYGMGFLKGVSLQELTR